MQNASYRPNDVEIAQLASIISQPGFEVLKRIQLGEIDQFQLDLMSVDPTDKDYESQVRAKHNIALSAGMFYQRVTNKVATYIAELGAKRDQPQIQPDQTADLLDY